MGKLRDLCSTWSRVLIDLLAMILLGALSVGVYSAEKNGHVAVRRGFFCDDTSIRLPYKPSTVPSWALIICSVCTPFVVIIIGNLVEHFVTKYECSRPPFRPLGSFSAPKVCLCVPPWVARIMYHLRWYFIGLLSTLILTDTSKVVVGRLRPNFIDVCKPDFSKINCTDAFGNPVYVTDYTCTGDPELIPDTRYSWPSGHSSISAYTFIFVCFYVASVRVFYHRSALKLALILASFLLTWLTALSRVADNKHHPTDVLSGLILGAAVSAVVSYYNLYFFSHFNKSETNDHRRRSSDKRYQESSPEVQTSDYDRIVGGSSPQIKPKHDEVKTPL